VDESIRNRGGTNEQFIGAIRYDIEIKRVSDNGLIHVENGMYLWMKPTYLHPASADSIEEDVGQPEMAVGDGSRGPVFVPSQTICRSGTIPHGNSMLLIGNLTSNRNTGLKWEGNPNDHAEFWKNLVGDGTWPATGVNEHFAISPSMGGGVASRKDLPINLDKPAPKKVDDPLIVLKDPSGNVAYTQRIINHQLYPYSVRPDLRLRNAAKKQKINHFYTFFLDTRNQASPINGTDGPQGGILQTPFLNKYVPTTRVRFTMWIEEVEEDGHKFYQLQYEQLSQFEFGFGTDGGVTVWPHIQINTLRKVSK